MRIKSGISCLFIVFALTLAGCESSESDSGDSGTNTDADTDTGTPIPDDETDPVTSIAYDLDIETAINAKNQATGDDEVETIRPYLKLKMEFSGTITATEPTTWENCRLLFLLGPDEAPEPGSEISYNSILAVHPILTQEEATEVLSLNQRIDAIITHDLEPGRYNIWNTVECDVEDITHAADEEQEPADESAEPEVFSAEDAYMSTTTVEVTPPSEAMIFEQIALSTEVLMVNMLRNDAVIAHPDNPEELVYQPPHARRPVFDKPIISVSTAVTQAGVKPDAELPALPEGHHLDWNFTLELQDQQRPEGMPAPVKFQLSCKDRSLAENGNRVDGRVLFPAVSFPHMGSTAHFHCDAQVAPPANLPPDTPIDPLADFARVHPELFDINEQMEFEYPNANIRNGWWAVSVCMNHWENIGTEENPEQRFFRQRCAKKRLYIGKSDDFRVQGTDGGPSYNNPEEPNPSEGSQAEASHHYGDHGQEGRYKSTSTLFGVSETFADPSSGDNQLKANFEAGIQALDDNDTTGFRIGVGGEAFLDLLGGSLEVSLVEGALWAGYDVEDEGGYYEAGLAVFEMDVFDESSSNDVELSIEETASYSYTYSLSYGILGIITINFDMGFGASAGFEAGLSLEVDTDVDEADGSCLPGEDEITVVGRAGPVASMSASIGVSVTVLFWQGGVEATLNIVEAYVGPELDVGACLVMDDNNNIDGFYLFSGVWFGIEITVLSGDIEAYVRWVWYCGGGTIWSGSLYEFDGITYTYDLLDEEFDLNGSNQCGNQIDVLGDNTRGYALMPGVKCSGMSGASSLYTNTSATDLMETCNDDNDCVGFHYNHNNNKGKTFTGCSNTSNSSNHITIMKSDSCSASVFD